MATKREIILEVQEKGMDEVTDKANALASATKKVTDSSKEMADEQKSSANAVLENGGAMGLLNDVTGGYAMMVKDAVEASVLFTKSQKLLAIQQKIMTFVTSASSTALKLFRVALVSTGIGAIVVGIGLLIANFGKVKEVLMNLFPPLRFLGFILGGLMEAVTDFIGVTSDATRALDKMVADSEASLKRSEHFLEANGDKYDQYTRRKMQANIDYNKKVLELAEDEELTEQEKIKRLADFRAKANREIIKADQDREAEREKIRKEAAEKEAEEQRKIAEEVKRRRDQAIAKEKERTDAISKILEDYRKKEEDANAKSNLEKINLEEQRALDELNRLRATEEEKAKVRAYYNNLRKEDEQALQSELAAIEQAKNNSIRELELDQRQWEIDNETDPVVKLEKQRRLLQEQADYELDKLQKDIDNAKLSATERANAEIEYARVRQELNQSLEANDKEIAEAQKTRDQGVAENRKNIVLTTAQTIANVLGKGSELAKGMAVAQATQDTFKGANAAYASLATIPVVGPGLGAAAYAAAMIQGFNNVKKILATKPVEKSAPSGGSGGGAQAPAAPSFNLVQGTGTNQIAEAISNQQNPIQAYVVSSDVTSAQSLDRNIESQAKL